MAISNKQCLSQGGSSCLLNYEKQKIHTIRVQTTDNGSPQLSYEENFRIDVRDINDMPRDLQLSNNQVKEDAKINTLIGRFVSRDSIVTYCFIQNALVYVCGKKNKILLLFYWDYIMITTKFLSPCKSSYCV